VADAVAKYLADKRQQGLFDDTTSKLENIGEAIPRLVYVGQRPYLRDLDLERLREWRETWKGGALTRKKLQERVQGFFWFCLRSGWIGSHPAKGLGKIQGRRSADRLLPEGRVCQDCRFNLPRRLKGGRCEGNGKQRYAPFVKARRINMGEMMARAWA
jgi:hypothetical protein